MEWVLVEKDFGCLMKIHLGIHVFTFGVLQQMISYWGVLPWRFINFGISKLLNDLMYTHLSLNMLFKPTPTSLELCLESTLFNLVDVAK
jgi:hypothetical protein